MKPERATKKQRELLEYVTNFIKEHDYGPSYREIMRALDYKSVSTVATHVNGLVAKGFLNRKDNSPRSLEIARNSENGKVETKDRNMLIVQLDEKLQQPGISDDDKAALERVKELFQG